MNRSRSLSVTLVSLFFILLFTLLTLISGVYGVTVIFSSQSQNASFWLKAIVTLFTFFFPDTHFFIFVGILVSLLGVFAAVSLLRRERWARVLFVGVSALLFCWIIYRLYFTFTHIPPFVSIKAIFENNPITKYISILYFAVSFVLMIIEVILAVTLTVLLSKKAGEDFSTKKITDETIA